MLYQTKDEMMKELGVNLRALRLSFNLSQQMVADRSGISLKAVRNLEDGKNASTASLLALCRTLKATDWLQAIAPPLLDESAFERKNPAKVRQRGGYRHV